MKLYDVKNVKLLKKSGSLFFCSNCEKIIGSINERGYSYVNLVFLCNCNHDIHHHIEIADNAYIPESVNRVPAVNNLGVYCCRKCKTPLFSIINERVLNYSFHIKCVCGEEYDKQSIIANRLGETIKKINIKKMSAF